MIALSERTCKLPPAHVYFCLKPYEEATRPSERVPVGDAKFVEYVLAIPTVGSTFGGAAEVLLPWGSTDVSKLVLGEQSNQHTAQASSK